MSTSNTNIIFSFLLFLFALLPRYHKHTILSKHLFESMINQFCIWTAAWTFLGLLLTRIVVYVQPGGVRASTTYSKLSAPHLTTVVCQSGSISTACFSLFVHLLKYVGAVPADALQAGIWTAAPLFDFCILIVTHRWKEKCAVMTLQEMIRFLAFH